jgi:heat shock protein HslJ
MKAIIGFAFFLLFVAGIAFVTMQGKQMGQLGSSGAEITGIKWRAVSVGDEAIPANSGIYILFEVDGSIEGHAGCNGFFGSLEQRDSGVGVGPLGATRMACPEPIMNREVGFIDAVQKTASFQSTSDSLSLLNEESDVLVEFVADN